MPCVLRGLITAHTLRVEGRYGIPSRRSTQAPVLLSSCHVRRGVLGSQRACGLVACIAVHVLSCIAEITSRNEWRTYELEDTWTDLWFRAFI
jgi:hypothetical protein